jgi:hypothetical protein
MSRVFLGCLEDKRIGGTGNLAAGVFAKANALGNPQYPLSIGTYNQSIFNITGDIWDFKGF